MFPSAWGCCSSNQRQNACSGPAQIQDILAGFVVTLPLVRVPTKLCANCGWCGAVLSWYRTDGQAGGAKSAAAPLQCVTGRQFFPNALPYQPANPSLLLQETKAQKPTNPLYHAIWPFHISLSLPPCVVSCLGVFRAARARQGSYTPPDPVQPVNRSINNTHIASASDSLSSRPRAAYLSFSLVLSQWSPPHVCTRLQHHPARDTRPHSLTKKRLRWRMGRAISTGSPWPSILRPKWATSFSSLFLVAVASFA